MSSPLISRRTALHAGAAAATLACFPNLRLLAEDPNRKFKIGACDWSLGRMHEVSALELARSLGIDGVQVSFGAVGIPYDLRRPEARQAYRDAEEKWNVAISSLAMGELNNKAYATDPDSEQWVGECIDVLAQMGLKVVLLAFFSAGDLRDKPDAQEAVIRRLKKVAPRAEQAGVILGIESWLNADDHLRIIDAVGSPAVQVYYDVANMTEMGYDIFHEIRQLGRDRICEIHAKENGFLLGRGRVDFVKVRDVLDEIGWTGWLIIEGATENGRSLEECYKLNQEYLRSVFPT